MRTLRIAAAGVSLLLSSIVGASPTLAAETLTAPTHVVKVSAAKSAMKIAWEQDGDAPRFEVQYARESDFDPHATGLTSATSLLITNLVARTTYSVRVRALSDTNEPISPWSEVKRFRTGPMPLRIATFNVKDPDSKASDSGSCGVWSKRKAGVARDIVSSDAAVVGVQEVYDNEDRTSLMAAVRAAGGTYAMTPAEDSSAGWDSRLLYDTTKVTSVSSGSAAFAHQDGDGTDRKYVWGTFELKSNGHRFMVFTTHLEPGGSTSLKIGQWNDLRLAAKRTSVVDGKQLPVFITGDFNSSKFAAQSKTMLPRMKDSGFGDVLGQMYASYKVSGQRAKERKDAWINSYNGCKRKYAHVAKSAIGNNIDWIFATNSLAIPYWRTLTHHKGDLLDTPIPSDHFLLLAEALLP